MRNKDSLNICMSTIFASGLSPPKSNQGQDCRGHDGHNSHDAAEDIKMTDRSTVIGWVLVWSPIVRNVAVHAHRTCRGYGISG